MNKDKAADKLLAEWFWADRWTGSRAFLLPMEARGVYREMLTQAWRRGARLPNDHTAIQRAIGATAAEWRRAWPLVEGFWRVDGADLINETQQDIYAQTKSRSERATSKGQAGAHARHTRSPGSAQAPARAPAQAVPDHKPPSPSPSPISRTQTPAESSPPTARSKRPVFPGNRVVVFEWQWADLDGLLGPHAEGFDLHGWFDDLDQRCLRENLIPPDRDGGAWLKAETLAEARRRGIDLRVVSADASSDRTNVADVESILRRQGVIP